MCRQFKFKLGMEFSSLKEFKDAILEHSVLNGREIIFEKNDKVGARVRCSQTCDFVALVSKVGGSSTYRMKTLNSTHTCGRVFNNKNAKSKWVATKVADRFRSGQGVRPATEEPTAPNETQSQRPATEEPTAPNETQSQRPATEEPIAPNYTQNTTGTITANEGNQSQQPNANTNSEGVGNQGNQGKTPQASNVVSASTAQPTKRRGRPPTKNKTASKNPKQKGNDQESNQPIGTQQSTTSHVAAAITPTTPVATVIAQDVTSGNSYDWKNVANQLGQSKNEGYMNFMTHVEEAKKFCAENGFEPTATAEGGVTQSEVNSTRKDA
ncbi:Transposase, MuDR, plant [Sesbania bispinosa]|nr:Transposase, MuDR, plant [Sesbania bispinosa]